MRITIRTYFILQIVLWGISTAEAQPFRLPTSNQAIYQPGKEEDFFVGTVGRSWNSGTFGCVRSEGQQLHEGLDIRCLSRDKQGEATDGIMATADGIVVYFNKRPSLSNYGNYIVVRHHIEGIELYSLYAHLKEIRTDLKIGSPVRAGENLGVMGRSANTRQGISKERAHLHFELNLFVNDKFPEWFKKNSPGQRNDHGAFNGQNLAGLDPRFILLQQRAQGKDFSLLRLLRQQTVLCRVMVRDTQFPWLQRYPYLIRRNSVADREGIAGYEVALNYAGVPFELIPRAASEIKSKAKYSVLAVNAAEQAQNPCRGLVTRRGNSWGLTSKGTRWLDLLTY